MKKILCLFLSVVFIVLSCVSVSANNLDSFARQPTIDLYNYSISKIRQELNPYTVDIIYDLKANYSSYSISETTIKSFQLPRFNLNMDFGNNLVLYNYYPMVKGVSVTKDSETKCTVSVNSSSATNTDLDNWAPFAGVKAKETDSGIEASGKIVVATFKFFAPKEMTLSNINNEINFGHMYIFSYNNVAYLNSRGEPKTKGFSCQIRNSYAVGDLKCSDKIDIQQVTIGQGLLSEYKTILEKRKNKYGQILVSTEQLDTKKRMAYKIDDITNLNALLAEFSAHGFLSVDSSDTQKDANEKALRAGLLSLSKKNLSIDQTYSDTEKKVLYKMFV